MRNDSRCRARLHPTQSLTRSLAQPPPKLYVGCMRVFSYVVRVDDGFAPNPFHVACTIACCKPAIRRVALSGDLVVGLSSHCERVVYAMEVAETISFADYWRAPRYRAKRPSWFAKNDVRCAGGNAYQLRGDGSLEAVASIHHPDGPNVGALRRNLSGKRVLVGERFAYFGAESIPLPSNLHFLRVGRGHRSPLRPAEVAAVARWFRELPPGRHGLPALWPPPPVQPGRARSKKRCTPRPVC